MTMKKSNALKGIVVPPVELAVDDAMEYLPKTLDLSDPENRLRFRTWMVQVCKTVARQNAETFGRATMQAIDEAAMLAIHPKYYEEVRKRRQGTRARKKLSEEGRRQAAEAARVPPAMREFLNIKESKVRM